MRIQHLSYKFARWIDGNDIEPRKLNLTSSTMIVEDNDGRHVLLFENEWSIRWAEERNKELRLADIANKTT